MSKSLDPLQRAALRRQMLPVIVLSMFALAVGIGTVSRTLHATLFGWDCFGLCGSGSSSFSTDFTVNDDNGRPVITYHYDGNVAQTADVYTNGTVSEKRKYTYDAQGGLSVAALADANGQTTAVYHYAGGRGISQDLYVNGAPSGMEDYAYDGNSVVAVTEKDANGQTTAVYHYAGGRGISQDLYVNGAPSGTAQYVYDANGILTTETYRDANGKTTVYQFDAQGNVSSWGTPQVQNDSSSSVCNPIDCPAPPPGCHYEGPAMINGCPTGCGTLICASSSSSLACKSYGSCRNGSVCPGGTRCSYMPAYGCYPPGCPVPI